MRGPRGGRLIDDIAEQRLALLGVSDADFEAKNNVALSKSSALTFAGAQDDDDVEDWQILAEQKLSNENDQADNAFVSLRRSRLNDEDEFRNNRNSGSGGGATRQQLNFSRHDSNWNVTNSSFCWCSSMKLYFRIFLYCGALISVTFLLYVTLSRDFSSISTENKKGRFDGKLTVAVDKSKSPKIKIDVFMESQCPDTTRFINSQLLPTFLELAKFMDLNIIPYGKAKWSKLATNTDEEDYSIQCQHGPRECQVNQLMCCGIAKLKSVHKYLPYLACVQGTPPGGREQEKCDESTGLPSQELQECANGREGRVLHHKMGILTDQLRPSPFFIPWILVNGVREKRTLTQFKQVLCEKLDSKFGVKPKPCELSLATSPAAGTLPVNNPI